MIKRSDLAQEAWKGFGSSQAWPDLAIYRHDNANISHPFFQSRAYMMPSEHSAASSILKTITIRLHPPAAPHDPAAGYELALAALAAALLVADSSISPAWTIQPVPGDEPLLYNLTPLQGQPVSASAAWEMTAALRRQAEVAAAEPVFVTAQANHQAPHDTP